MATGPYFDSGGFERDQGNRIGVYLVDPTTGNPYTAGGGAGSSTVVAQQQFKEGAGWVDMPGTAARGLLVDPTSGSTDGGVGLPARIGVVGGYDGANVRAIKTSAAGILQVDVLSNVTSGVVGNVAHDSADSGNPIKMGARTRASDITPVNENDRADIFATLLGKLLVHPYALPANFVKGSANSALTADTEVIAAPGSGLRLYITTLIVTNTHASQGTKVQIKSGTTATGYPRIQASSGGGGAALTLPTPLRLGANEALQFANATSGADVDVSAIGYVAAE